MARALTPPKELFEDAAQEIKIGVALLRLMDEWKIPYPKTLEKDFLSTLPLFPHAQVIFKQHENEPVLYWATPENEWHSSIADALWPIKNKSAIVSSHFTSFWEDSRFKHLFEANREKLKELIWGHILNRPIQYVNYTTKGE